MSVLQPRLNYIITDGACVEQPFGEYWLHVGDG
jgi:hypothetical protein